MAGCDICQREMEPSDAGEKVPGNVECAVRQVFQDFPKWNADNWRSNGEDVSEACRVQLESYERAIEDIENAENKVREVEAKQMERMRKINENARATELMKLKRQPFYTDLERGFAEKYALLESSDLWPEVKDDFRTNELARGSWKRSLSARSKDMIFEVADTSLKLNIGRNDDEKIYRKLTKVKSEYSIARSWASRLTVTFQKPRRSIMRTQEEITILTAQPNHVEFVNFEPRKIYRKTIVMKNVSNAVAKFKTEPRSSTSKFSLVFESRTGDRENIAPGMHVRMIIVFSSEDGDDSEERIVFKVQFGKPVLVLVSAYRDPPIVKGTNYDPGTFEECISSNVDTRRIIEESSEDSWANFARNGDGYSSDTLESPYVYVRKKEITESSPVPFAHLECNKCFVGEKIIVTTRLKNFGGDGRFLTMSEFDWNSMSIDDITMDNRIILPRFAIRPAYFSLKRNEQLDFLTYFFPDSRGVQVDKLYIACDNLAVHPIELIGDGVVYDPGIVSFEDNVQKNSDDDRCELRMNLGIGVLNGILGSTIVVTNTSCLKIHYRWEKRLTDVEETKKKAQTTWKDLPVDLLSVTPSNGIFPTCSTITFNVTAELTNLSADLYRVVLQLFLEDIPLAAIPEEYQGQAEAPREIRRLCAMSRDIRDKEIEVWVRCTGSSSSHSQLFSSNASFEIIEYHDDPPGECSSFSISNHDEV